MAGPQGMPGKPINQQEDERNDPVLKFKGLIPHLKESLANLMRIAAQIFQQNSQADNCVKAADGNAQRLDKALEEFYAIVDQIEVYLKVSLQCHGQAADSTKNAPVPVAVHSVRHEGDQTQNYATYLTTVRTQISCVKEVHDQLVELSKQISERRSQQPQSQPSVGTSQPSSSTVTSSTPNVLPTPSTAGVIPTPVQM